MTDQTQNQALETVEVTDLNSFFQLLSAWHTKQVSTAGHFLEIPEGSDVTLGDVTVKLEGDKRDAFIAGVTLTLQLLGDLPFLPIVEDAPNEPTA